MPEILLATLNAKHIHSALGLRCLMANLGPLRERAALLEFDLAQRPLEIVEQMLAVSPRIVGLGVYIWNVAPITEVVELLRRLRPGVAIVLGGPEVICETDLPPVAGLADWVIAGEADLEFAALCRDILAAPPPAGGADAGGPFGAAERPCPSPGMARKPRIIRAGHARLADLALPYEFYSDTDIAHRIVYVEASRGCPFACEFCLSSLEALVRQFDVNLFLGAMERLLGRGVRHFKFVDRTFNLNIEVCVRILEFFLARLRDGLFLHFEMVPDRLPVELREVLARFPAGTLQIELGIQTFNDEVARRINRRQDCARIAENLRFLRQHTRAHLHTDLIIGLPGERIESIADGFDRLIALEPHEIQMGILKRLRGVRIIRHDDAWGMVYSPLPPYELIESRTLDFPTLQRLRRFARYWDLIGNSGNFVETTLLLWAKGGESPFAGFLRLSDWLFAQTGRQHAIALPRLAELAFEYLTRVLGCDPTVVAASVLRDYRRSGRSGDLAFLREDVDRKTKAHRAAGPRRSDRRQARHRAADDQSRRTAR